ncbi:MAG: hypothetical protein J6B20_02410 [Clostridia bacterium]|nr:hypothetical protein [Clostridia bacterium]
MREKGYVSVNVVLLPDTLLRLEAVREKRGLTKRTDAVKEAICDYIAKYEKEQNNG